MIFRQNASPNNHDMSEDSFWSAVIAHLKYLYTTEPRFLAILFCFQVIM